MPSWINPTLKELVRERARHRCEYCRVGSAEYRSPFPIDHIRARQHGGMTVPENLALACLHCNLHKGPNLAGVDPVDGSAHLLFDPRTQRWGDHFSWAGPTILGLTPAGRATIAVLAMNAPDPIRVRASLIEQGVFPPAETA